MKYTLMTTAAIFALNFASPALAHCGNCGEDDNHAKNEKISAEHSGKHMDKPNLVTIAAENEDFSTLVAALKAAELVETVTNAENITIFAPTNDAFAKLPEGTLDDLLKPENKEKLQDILKYHVLGQKVKSKKIADGTSEVATLQGSNVEVTKDENGVSVDGAKVTSADIYGSNGVIHVIDSVILPN